MALLIHTDKIGVMQEFLRFTEDDSEVQVYSDPLNQCRS